MGELSSYIAIIFAIAIWCLLDAPAEAKQVFVEDGDASTTASSFTTASTTNNVTPEVPRPILVHLQGSSDENADIIERNPRSQRPTLIDIAVQASAREGLNAIAEFYGKTLPDIVRNGQLLADDHPAALLSKFSAADEDSERREMAGFATVLATKAFRKNYKYINELARQAHTPKISLRRTALEGLCPPREPPTCMPASERYRTHDGTCNNKRRPRWGAAQMPFNRFLPPEYGDGVDSIRSSVDGGPLSSSRFVSLLVHGAKDGEAALTLMTVQWGQLLDHDLTATAQPRSINGSVPSCCGSKDFHPSCFPIKVPLDDPWLAPLKVRCLEFLRSAPAQRRDCVLSWREQTNQATSYIDASPIYSNSAKSSDNARVFRNGLLIYGRGPPADDVCQRGAIEPKCIRAGDGRSSEQPGLLALHHVWVSEHNRIAMELSEMNLHWSDEKIYQETRRIIGAMFQHITYREFLPIILGREVCKLFDLELLNSGYYEGYDARTNPTVANSFAAAAFRFGHSLVQNSYMRCDHHHNAIGNNVSLHEEFQRGDIGSAGSLHRLLRGMSNQRALKRDEFITPELTNHLFQTPGFPFGLDLAAINIQRGRDHGVPPYTSWRVPCGLTPINTWDDFANVVGPESARRIGHAYRSVHDVDLFVGGIAERPVVGGLVGPTFACVIAQQFSNSRKGDRFWYENGNFESSFTPAQLHSIRRVSLAQVLCRTVGGGTFQPHIFIPPEFPGNNRLPCGFGPLEPIDLSPWLEQDPFAAPPLPIQTFSTEMPERVFDIVSSTQLDTANALTAMQVNKENKVGFPNRSNAFRNSTALPHIQFIPNSSAGFHRPPKNATKVSDKLDIKIKGGSSATTQKRPILTVINGINNKLDKENVNTKRQRVGSSTRRTVVVNNVPIELRSATELTIDSDDGSVKAKSEEKIKMKKQSKRNRSKFKDRVEARHGMHDQANGSEEDEDDYIDGTTVVDESGGFDIFFAMTEPTNFANASTEPDKDKEKFSNIEKTDYTETLNNETAKTGGDEFNLKFSVISEIQTEKDIDPMTHSPTHELKRVQRKLDGTKITDITDEDIQFGYALGANPVTMEKERSPRVTKNTNNTKTVVKTNPTSSTTKAFIGNRVFNVTVNGRPALLHAHKKRVIHKLVTTTVTPSPSPETTSTTVAVMSRKSSKAPLTTVRNVELRQYQTPGGYTRPHKVIVDGPNSDQYEIEINIRQTNKSPPSRPIGNNAEYTTVSNRDTYYGYDRYPTHYPTSTLQPPYYQAPPPSLSSQLNQNHRTKPPTIIYLNEQDERRTTTRQPGFLQNFFTFATGPLSGNRPYPSSQKEKPQSHTIFGSSSPHSSHIAVSAAPQFIGRPSQSQVMPSSSFSEALANGGSAHASSLAVSNGQYGSIVGVASANGADSTFSFNIRPRPGISGGGTQKPIPSGAGSYGLFSPQAQHQPEYISHPETYYEKPSYGGNGNSPFSTAVKNPVAQSYYSRHHEISGIHKSESSDYEEYLSRTLEPLLTNFTEISDINKRTDSEDYQYEDYDENVTSNEHVNNSLLGNLFKIKAVPSTNDTCDMTSPFDDNYVLRVLNMTSLTLTDTTTTATNPNTELVTNFPDALSKQIANDILADEDYDMTGQRQREQQQEQSTMATPMDSERGSQAIIAFAPIRILTQPERPDNWIHLDISNKSILPELPLITSDSMTASEIPQPIKGLGNIRLLKDESREEDLLKSDHAKRVEKELSAEPRLNS